MSKTEAIKILKNHLQELKNLHVADMMVQGSWQELKDLCIRLGEDFFFAIDEYLYEESLSTEAVDKQTIYELVLFIFNEGNLLYDCVDDDGIDLMIEILKEKNEKLATSIAEYIEQNGILCESSVYMSSVKNEGYEAYLKNLLGLL